GRAVVLRLERPAVEDLAAGRALGLSLHHARLAVRAEARQAHVLHDRAAEQEPLLLARLGDHRQPAPQAAGRTARLRPPAPELHRARAAAVHSENRAGELRAARAHEPGDADDLALAHL